MASPKLRRELARMLFHSGSPTALSKVLDAQPVTILAAIVGQPVRGTSLERLEEALLWIDVYASETDCDRWLECGRKANKLIASIDDSLKQLA